MNTSTKVSGFDTDSGGVMKSEANFDAQPATQLVNTFELNYLANSFAFCIVILIGDVSVGKTCLLSRYLKNQLPKSAGPTIGVEFATKNVIMKDGATVKAQLWDTAGQEKYRAITVAHYRKALGCLIVYDITHRKTFSNVKFWLDSLLAQAEQDICIMLVGNKLDVV